MTPRTLAEVERALRAVAWGHDPSCMSAALPWARCSCGGSPDYPALAAQVWAWLEEPQARLNETEMERDEELRIRRARDLEIARLTEERDRLRNLVRDAVAWDAALADGDTVDEEVIPDWRIEAEAYLAALAPAEGITGGIK